MNQRVQKFVNGSTNGITIAGITASSGVTVRQLSFPRDLTFDANETNLYVADANNHRIIRFAINSTSGDNGTVVAGGNGAGNTINTLKYPWGVFSMPSVSSDLFIANYDGHSVTRWTPGATSGTFIAGTPGVSGANPTQLYNPMGVKIDVFMNVYVADANNHRVQLFCNNNQTGSTIAGNGAAGNSPWQLNQPRNVAFDSEMNLYVSDNTNRRVQKFLKL